MFIAPIVLQSFGSRIMVERVGADVAGEQWGRDCSQGRHWSGKGALAALVKAYAVLVA